MRTALGEQGPAVQRLLLLDPSSKRRPALGLIDRHTREGMALLIQRDNEATVGWQRMLVPGPLTAPRTGLQIALEVLAEVTVAPRGS